MSPASTPEMFRIGFESTVIKGMRRACNIWALSLKSLRHKQQTRPRLRWQPRGSGCPPREVAASPDDAARQVTVVEKICLYSYRGNGGLDCAGQLVGDCSGSGKIGVSFHLRDFGAFMILINSYYEPKQTGIFSGCEENH